MRRIILALSLALTALMVSGTAMAQNLTTYVGDDGTAHRVTHADPLPTAGATSHTSYTLLNAATSTGAQSIAPDTYTLTFPTAFNGATISVAVTDPSGNVITTAYTSAPTTPVAGYYGATSVTATASGGTPTGSLKLNGGPPASSSGGGGGGDASAANQTLQITQETALNTVFGTAVASPTQYTVSDRLKTINTTLGGILTFKIDQTTPGVTDSVSIKNDDGHKGEVGGNQNPTTVAQTVTPNGAAIGSTSGSSTTLTIASTSVGSIIVGSALTCTGCTTGTTVTAIGTYSAGAGTVTMSAANTIAGSTAITFTQPYASGMAVGGLMTVANAARISGKSSFLQSLIANIKSAQTIQIDIFMFNANPTGSTCTDRTAFSLAAADFDKVKGVVHITDWTAAGTPSVGEAQNQAMPMHMTTGTGVWACAVVRGASTYTATTDVSLSYSFVRD